MLLEDIIALQKDAYRFVNDFLKISTAYSLRKIVRGYNGYCIKVRRDSDNATKDIGFKDNVLDIQALMSFVGTGSGFVDTWYDQSGNNNATQSTLARQPKIVISGVLQLVNNRPALKWDTSGQYLQTADILTSWDFYNRSLILVAKPLSLGAVEDANTASRLLYLLNGTEAKAVYLLPSDGTMKASWDYFSTTTTSGATIRTNANNVLCLDRQTSGVSNYKVNFSQSGTANQASGWNTASGNFFIGSRGADRTYNGFLQELIVTNEIPNFNRNFLYQRFYGVSDG